MISTILASESFGDVIRTGLLAAEILLALLVLIYYGAKLGTLGVLRGREFWERHRKKGGSGE